MLNQPTLDKLATLHLHGMAEAFRTQADPTQRDGLASLSFEERFGLLVDQEWTWRQNRALARRLLQAKFRYRASVEDIDFRLPRGLDRSRVRSLNPKFGLGHRASEHFLVRPVRGGEKLARLRPRGESLPGRIQRFLHPHPQTVSRVGPGARRRQLGDLAGSTGPHRRADRR